MIAGVDPELAESIARATVLAALAHAYRAPSYQSKPGPAPKLNSVRLLGLDDRISVDREIAESAAINLARWLVNCRRTGSMRKSYRDVLKTLAKSNGWRMKFFSESETEKAGRRRLSGRLAGQRDTRRRHRPTAVSTGESRQEPRGRAGRQRHHLRYRRQQPEAVQAHARHAHDMGGSAVAVATLQALTQVDYPEAVDCWLAITENRIDAAAYKSR